MPGRFGEDADAGESDGEFLCVLVVGVGISSSGVVSGEGPWMCRSGTGELSIETAWPLRLKNPLALPFALATVVRDKSEAPVWVAESEGCVGGELPRFAGEDADAAFAAASGEKNPSLFGSPLGIELGLSRGE